MAAVKLNVFKTMYNNLPSMQVSKDKVIDKVAYIGKKWSSPHQRAILGITAIAIQPYIDWKNKNVDEKTRKVAVARTCAKNYCRNTYGCSFKSCFY